MLTVTVLVMRWIGWCSHQWGCQYALCGTGLVVIKGVYPMGGRRVFFQGCVGVAQRSACNRLITASVAVWPSANLRSRLCGMMHNRHQTQWHNKSQAVEFMYSFNCRKTPFVFCIMDCQDVILISDWLKWNVSSPRFGKVFISLCDIFLVKNPGPCQM